MILVKTYKIKPIYIYIYIPLHTTSLGEMGLKKILLKKN